MDFEQGFWGWFSRPRQPEMVTLPDGRSLKQFQDSGAEVDPSALLDFSYLNPALDAAISHGLVRFSTNAGELPPAPLPVWTMAQAARYLRVRGFPGRDIWCKHLDEQAADRYPQMATNVTWLRQHAYRPYSTFHNLLAHRQKMIILNSTFEIYQGGFPPSPTATRVWRGHHRPRRRVLAVPGLGGELVPLHPRPPGGVVRCPRTRRLPRARLLPLEPHGRNHFPLRAGTI